MIIPVAGHRQGCGQQPRSFLGRADLLGRVRVPQQSGHPGSGGLRVALGQGHHQCGSFGLIQSQPRGGIDNGADWQPGRYLRLQHVDELPREQRVQIAAIGRTLQHRQDGSQSSLTLVMRALGQALALLIQEVPGNPVPRLQREAVAQPEAIANGVGTEHGLGRQLEAQGARDG